MVVFVVSEDLQERGLEGVPLVEGLTPVARSGLARLFDHYDQVWHW
jgi:sulfur relay (sulfurtransferase) DsrF/TusC family protein